MQEEEGRESSTEDIGAMTANLSAGGVPPPCSGWLQATVLIGFKGVHRSASSALVDCYASFELLRDEGGA